MRKIIVLTALVVYIAALALAFQEPRPKVEGRLWWVFFNTGKAPKQKYAKEELQKMQTGHLGNFEKQYRAGRLFMAGPLGDNGFIRGTAVLKAKDKEELMTLFKDDEFVQNGVLDVEALPIFSSEALFKKAKEPFVITKMTLAIFKKGPKWTNQTSPELNKQQSEHVKGLMEMFKNGDVAYLGPFLDDDAEKRGIVLFWSPEEKEVKKLMDTDPHVKAGHLVYELHPQLLGEGTFGDRPKKGN